MSKADKFGLYEVGSTVNGFGSLDSDYDLCLMIGEEEQEVGVKTVLILALFTCDVLTPSSTYPCPSLSLS